MAFTEQGARVAFLDIQDEAAALLIGRVESSGHPAPVFLHCDLTDIESLRRAIDEVIEVFGTVDVLVNNAANDTRHTIEEVTPESWDRAIAINLRSQFFMAQTVIPMMKNARCGSIINMSSICWMIPSTGMPVYVTAKAAIVGLTRTLAHELGADNIRVNCVLPVRF